MKESSLVNESLLRQRLTELGSKASWAPHILSGLERFIRTAGDYDLFRVNPIQYATANGLSETEGIELFVHAAKVGLFEMQWLLICAYCPQVAGSFRELDQVHPRFQCEFCNALNDVALDDYIQVTFTVSSAARDIVASAHYGPGGRGYAGSSRAAGYGAKAMADHKADSAVKTVVVAQIEDVEALDEIDEIAAVDGIDALFVGRIDLTVALGCESPDDPRVVAAVERIVAACVAARRPVGMFLSRPSDVPLWRAKGATLFLLGSDHGFVRSGAQALRTSSGL